MKLLPTMLARQLLRDRFQARMGREGIPSAVDIVAMFQRMCLVTDFDTAVDSVKHFFAVEHRNIGAGDLAVMRAVYDIAKQDILGHAVDSLLEVMDNRASIAKDRINAAAVINELYGEKQLIKDERLTDKLMINLVQGGN